MLHAKTIEPKAYSVKGNMLTPASPQYTQLACPTKDRDSKQAGMMKHDDHICQRKECAC